LRDLVAVVLFVLLIRVPFLRQAIQGDDVNYLTAAQYAQINPAHPNHAEFVFLGKKVSMRGHPHPPLNVWVLAGLLAWTGGVDEVTYHAAYAAFSLTAAIAALSLARRFTPFPLWAALLTLSAPAFVVNGNSLESDLPFFAFWLASIALFIRAVDTRSAKWLAAAALAMPLAAMTAFQSGMMAPILALYLWRHGRDWKPAWAALAVVPATLAGWQLFEKLSSGALPAEVLAGYFQTYGLQRLENKLRNALALTTHAGWLLFPALTFCAFRTHVALVAAATAAAAWFLDFNPLFWIPFGCGLMLLAWCWRHRDEFLAQWVLVFFAAALILFFAGSARYLLPIAAPAALLAARHTSRMVLIPAFVCQLALGLALAKVNYDHWGAYRDIATHHERDWANKRVWINGEMGLRYYTETLGALPVEQGQPVRPGQIVVQSSLLLPVPYTTGGGIASPLAKHEVRSAIPLRLISPTARSGYSDASRGLRAFDIDTQPIDTVEVLSVSEATPSLSYLPMNAPEAATQIVSGLHSLEDNRYRWMAKRAVLLLKRPPQATPIVVDVFVPPQSPARELTVTLDGDAIERTTLQSNSGSVIVVTNPMLPADGTATLVLEVDKTFSVPGDHRELGIIVAAAGFR
jgi:hypothetical protein